MNNIHSDKDTLADAPEHVQLAVDFIHMLESNNIESQIALDALLIVIDDLKRKIGISQTSPRLPQ